MANPEHVEILKQGVEVWNKWRKENPLITPNLNHHKHIDAYGKGIAKLSGINLCDASVVDINFIEADLTNAKLIGADLRMANLKYADLRYSDLSMANLMRARLKGAKLNNTMLYGTNFISSSVRDADFSGALFGDTIIGGLDLVKALGLQDAKHSGPSFIDLGILIFETDKLPNNFLRGCGVPENFIQYMSSLTGKAFEYYSCFISYSSKNQDFAERLHADLQNKGVRCWFAPEDMKIGDKIRDRIDQSIRIHDKLLLILSDNSINSEWVEDEVEAAYEQERQRGKTVLFPIRLDSAVMDTDKAWAAKLRRSRNIGDFSYWKDHDAYQKAFDRLMRDLKAEEPAGSD